MQIDINDSRFKPENLAKDSLWSGSVDMDWQAMLDAYHNGTGTEPEMAIPYPTESVLNEYWPEFDQWEKDNPASDFEDAEDRLNAAIEAFEQSGFYAEWTDTFFPVMNYAYPVKLRYGDDSRDVATRIDALAGCVSLADIDGQHYFALTGGGMDLSWNICAAFIAAGLMPPVKYLRDLPGYASSGKYRSNLTDPVAALVVACLPVAADCLEIAAKKLRESVAAVSNERESE